MSELKTEHTLKKEKQDCVWRYLPRDNRSVAHAAVEFLDTTGGRDKVNSIKNYFQ